MARFLLISLITLLIFSCNKKESIYEPSARVDPYKIYKEGLVAFTNNDYFIASKKFSEAELNFIDPELAAKSSLMASYSVNIFGLPNSSWLATLFMALIFTMRLLKI